MGTPDLQLVSQQVVQMYNWHLKWGQSGGIEPLWDLILTLGS